MKTQFGTIIKKLRENAGISQEELGKIIGVSDKTISSWEINRTEPKMEIVQKISEYFNVSTDYLIKGDNYIFSYGNHQENLDYFADNPELLENYRHITENDNLKLLFDSTKDLSPQELEPVLILIDGIRRQKGLK